MNKQLLEFQAKIAFLDLFRHIVESEGEWNRMLDLRDENAFESEWLRVDEEIRAREAEMLLEDDERKVLEQIRERTFKIAFQNTRNAEIAASVSDDFDVMARAKRVGLNNSWLDNLIQEYATGKFPFQLQP